MLERRSLDAGKKFLGKFPIKYSRGHETHRIIGLTNEAGTNEIDLSLCGMKGQININAAWSYEKVDSLLVPQLILMRDLYNETLAAIKMGALFDLTQTQNVLPPRFHLSMEQQGNLKTAKTNPEDLRNNYLKLVQDICAHYGVKGAKSEDDWAHQRRMILPVMPGYSVQLTVPDGLTQTFEVHADNRVDYTHLDEISRQLSPLLKRNLGDKIKIYDDRVTDCHILISLDTSVPNRLDCRRLEKLVLEA